MAHRRSKPHRLRRAVKRWRRAWTNYRRSASREALTVVVVLAAATAVGFGAARLWLPHKQITAEQAELSPMAPAGGHAAEKPQKPVDLAKVVWESAAVAPAAGPGPSAKAAPEASGAPAWQKFAAAMPDTHGRPMISVVIDDVGVDKRRSAEAIALPQPVTLAFLPYANDIGSQVQAARREGHELLVHLPMEAEDAGRDPGPNALMTEIGDSELLRRLHWNLDRFDGYVGVNNHMGSRFTRDRHAMEMVMSELRDRGLLYLDSKTVAETLGPELAREEGVPFASRQVFLDNDQSAEGVEARLEQTERIAREHGYAIAIGHPHDGTLAALREWLPRVQRDGYVLVPVSAIVRHNWALERSTARQPG
jgi:polysaccharide deacetylase 2 family uncharacterized protein YibQ